MKPICDNMVIYEGDVFCSVHGYNLGDPMGCDHRRCRECTFNEIVKLENEIKSLRAKFHVAGRDDRFIIASLIDVKKRDLVICRKRLQRLK